MDELKVPVIQAHDPKSPRTNDSKLGRKNSYVKIANQDYIFAAIVKAGPLVSSFQTETYYQVFDMQDADYTSLVFSMNVLDMSKLMEAHPTIQTTGLLGWWKLLRHDAPVEARETFVYCLQRPPRIILQEALTNVSGSCISQLTHGRSADFVRHRYERLLAIHHDALESHETKAIDDA